MKHFLAERSDGRLFLRVRGASAEVLTTAAAAARLGRTRRHLYRLLDSGVLREAGKVLGERLIEKTSVESLARRPSAAQRPPARLARLLPEHSLAELNAGRDRDLFLARVLGAGDSADLRWARRRYGRRAIAAFVAREGARVLDARSLRLWSLVFGVRPAPKPPWRKAPWPG